MGVITRSQQKALDLFQLLELPDACLLRVLRLLWSASNDTRSLFRAARAHGRLRATAAASLTALTAELDSQQQTDGVLRYLSQHGQHVTSLSLKKARLSECAVRELPDACSQLRSLCFDNVDCQLVASSSHQGVLQACGGQLTRLEVDACGLLDHAPAATAAALAGLTGLQRLQLRGRAINEQQSAAANCTGVVGAGLPGCWSALTGLTHLRLNTGLLADAAAVEGISRLAQLRELELRGPAVSPAVLSGLQHLTWLSCGRIEPTALASVSGQLRHLDLTCAHTAPDNAAGTGALLDQLAHQQQLTSLNLLFALRHPAPSAAAYAALTASSGLQSLWLSSDYLPPGALQHVFAAGRQLSALTLLELGGFDDAEPLAGDIAAAVVANVCPGLLNLRLPPLDATAAQLQPLSRLEHLTFLRTQRVADASRAAGALGQLPTLQQLEIYSPANLPEQATLLLPLTQLRRLEFLAILHNPIQAQMVFENEAPEGAPPDVWRQLLEQLCIITDDPDVGAGGSRGGADGFGRGGVGVMSRSLGWMRLCVSLRLGGARVVQSDESWSWLLSCNTSMMFPQVNTCVVALPCLLWKRIKGGERERCDVDSWLSVVEPDASRSIKLHTH